MHNLIFFKPIFTVEQPEYLYTFPNWPVFRRQRTAASLLLDMKPSDELAELIRSMSPSEKRYFKLQASTFKDDSHYLLLFDAIDKEVATDDAGYRVFLERNKVSVPLSRLKNYLYQLVMKTLREYHLEHYPEFKIIEAYRDYRLQKDRKLDRQASKSLHRAIKLAKQYERYAYLWEINRHALSEVVFEPDAAKYLEHAQAVAQEQEATLAALHLIDKSQQMCSRAISFQKEQIKTNDESRLAAMEALVAQAIEMQKGWLPSYSYMQLHTVLNICYAQVNRYDLSLENNTALIQMLKEKPVEMGVTDEDVFFAYTNQLYHLVYQGKISEFKALTAEIEANPGSFFISKTEYYPAALLFSAYSFEVSLAILSGNFEEGLQYLPRANKVIEQHPDAASSEFLFSWYYRLMILYFGLGRFEDALDVINLILEGKVLRFGPDFGGYIRMVNIIVHFELGNQKLLPSTMKATEQFMRNRGPLGTVDKLLLEMLKKLIKAQTPQAVQRICVDYADKIQATVDSDPTTRVPLIYFDFLTWLRGRADNLLFGEAIRRKQGTASL